MPRKEDESAESQEQIVCLQKKILETQEEIFVASRNHQDSSEAHQHQLKYARQLFETLYPSKPKMTRIPYLRVIK